MAFEIKHQPIGAQKKNQPPVLTKVQMDDRLTARRAGPLEGVHLSLTEGGIAPTCAPESIKNLQPEDQPHICRTNIFEVPTTEATPNGWPSHSATSKPMAATLSFQGQGGTHRYALSPNLAGKHKNKRKKIAFSLFWNHTHEVAFQLDEDMKLRSCRR